jgi:ABC-type Fe3+-hydroxamate transport system substrate-binding protein
VGEAQAAAAEQVGGDCEISLAAIYPGPTVAAFVDGPWELPSAFQAVGCELVPGPDEAPPDANGRAWLSEEQLGLLDRPTLVLLQSDAVDGESDALAAITSSAIWQTLPAVAADSVVVVDCLGYPGAQGLIRFYGEITRIVGAADD